MHLGAASSPQPRQQPSVSVIVPCHNAERWVSRSISSVLAQDYPLVDLIVVDDGSTDASRTIISSFEGRLQAVCQEHHGAPAARNRGLRLSRSDFVLFLDADDELCGDYVAQLVAVAGGRPDVVVGRVARTTDGGAIKEDVTYHDVSGRLELLAAYLSDPIQTTGLMWRRDFVVRQGGWDETLLIGQDHELAIRLMLALDRFAIADTQDCYAAWREHDGPTITSTWTERKLLDRLRSLLKHRQAILALADTRIEHALALRLYQMGRWAFMEGHSSIGRQALGEARKLKLAGHPGTAMHSLMSTALGLELKSRLSKRFAGLRGR
jgi:glycosyltransferase involved in cell wall biosynthesis